MIDHIYIYIHTHNNNQLPNVCYYKENQCTQKNTHLLIKIKYPPQYIQHNEVIVVEGAIIVRALYFILCQSSLIIIISIINTMSEK